MEIDLEVWASRVVHTSTHVDRSETKPTFTTKRYIVGLLHDSVRLDESFPTGPRSTYGNENV
jgi:hypothetical protein